MGAENHTLQAGLDGTARLCPKQNETRKNKPIIILPQWAKTCLSCYVQNSEIPTLQNYKTNRKITIPPPPTPAPGRQDGLVLELKALAAKLDHLDLTRNPHGGRKLTPQFSSNLHTHVFHPQIIKWHEKKKKKAKQSKESPQSPKAPNKTKTKPSQAKPNTSKGTGSGKKQHLMEVLKKFTVQVSNRVSLLSKQRWLPHLNMYVAIFNGEQWLPPWS